jgi:ribosomal protein S18 acetylase RimI-like enzyme
VERRLYNVMAIRLVSAEPQHLSTLGSICFEAFKEVQDRGCGSRDFPTEDVARQVLGMLVQRDDFYSVSALDDGRVVGSNFLSLMDPVAGVGPLTVDPSYQGLGVGRALMQDVLDYAQHNNIEEVRLFHDAFNVASLSLYASMGFDVKDSVVLMQAAPAAETDNSVRPIAEADLPAIEELSRRIYKTSRRNEVAAAAPYGFAAFLRERQGRITGYLIPGNFGHGVAETEEDALALVGEAARRVPPEFARFFCPLSEGGFYRKALQAGCRAIKGMNYMTLGPYEHPDEVWMPSVLY